MWGRKGLQCHGPEQLLGNGLVTCAITELTKPGWSMVGFSLERYNLVCCLPGSSKLKKKTYQSKQVHRVEIADLLLMQAMPCVLSALNPRPANQIASISGNLLNFIKGLPWLQYTNGDACRFVPLNTCVYVCSLAFAGNVVQNNRICLALQQNQGETETARLFCWNRPATIGDGKHKVSCSGFLPKTNPMQQPCHHFP